MTARKPPDTLPEGAEAATLPEGEAATLSEGHVVRGGGAGCRRGGGAGCRRGGGAVADEQAAFDGRQHIGGCQMGWAFALQESAEGGGGERGGDAAALHGELGAVAHAQQAAARVAGDVGALRCQLRRIDGHHIAIVEGEEGLAAGGARRGHLIRDGQTAAHTGRGQTAGCTGCVQTAGRSANRFPLLASHLPIALVAALLETGYDLPEMGGSAVAGEDLVLHHQEEVQVFRHDDIVLNGHHGIVRV